MNKQILLSLSGPELIKLKELLATKANDKTLANLLQSLDEDDPDNFIRSQVFSALSHMSGKPISSIKEKDSLDKDLGLTTYHKRALKLPFQRIIDSLNGTKVVAVKECEKLKSVSDCIKLIKGKI